MTYKLAIIFSFFCNFLVAQIVVVPNENKVFNDLSKAEKLELLLKENKKNDLKKLKLYREICREYVDIDNKKLQDYATEMLQLSNQLNDKNGKADAYNFLGIVEDINSQFEKALLFYKKGLSIAKANKNRKLIASIGNNIGLIEWKKGKYKDALFYFYDSLQSAEKLGLLKMQGNITSNIGLVFQDLKQYDESLKWQKKALSLRKKENDEYGIASTFTNIASSYSYLNKSDSAVYFQKKAITIQEKLEDDYGLGISYFNLGNEYESTGRQYEAIKLYDLSKNIREKIEDSLGLTYTYTQLSKSKMKVGNSKEALLFGEKSLVIAKKINSPERIAASSKELSAIYQQIGNYLKALILFKQYSSYHENIFNKETNEKIADLTIKYEVDRKEKQLSIAKLEAEESLLKSKQKNIYLVLLGILFIFLLIIFRNYKVKNALQKKQMILKNKLLEEQSYSKMQEQRLEISRDLHDSLGAQLTLMSCVLDDLQIHKPDLNSKFAEKIDILSDFSKSSIADLRNTLWLLHQDEIFVEDLKFKIMNFVKDVSESKEELNIDLDFQMNDNCKINSRKAAQIFLIFQEILNNAVKYSNADDIQIKALFELKYLALKISDNGIGFDSTIENEKSYGLQNIKHRMNDLKGEFILDTSIGNGTKYHLKINVGDD